MRAGRLGRLAFRLEERLVEHVLHQRRLARSGHAGDADQALEGDAHVDVLEVVLACAQHLEEVPRLGRRVRLRRAAPAGQVFGS
jgi:hypothetical protein